MELHLIAVGRVRHDALRAACEGYLVRLRRFVRLEVREVRESGGRGRRPATVQAAEAAALVAAAPDRARLIGLSRSGRTLSSEQFARQLGTWQRDARDVALLIGGAFGLAPDLLARCEATIALSSLTLSHELARLVLLEQLYRACTILRGEPYHKGTPA